MSYLHGDVHSHRPIEVEEDHTNADDNETNDNMFLGDENTSDEDGETDEKADTTDDGINPHEPGPEFDWHDHTTNDSQQTPNTDHNSKHEGDTILCDWRFIVGSNPVGHIGTFC